jgi:hypothetical protein
LPQLKLPGVFMQVVSRSQPPLFAAHSSTSVQPVAPLPVYPAGQAPQVSEPGVFVQVVSGSQPPLLVAHSLMSVQPEEPPPV